ncbi:GNAT family N-acetyltransferase [soil metagenome]
MSEFPIDEIPIPATLQSAGAADFIGALEVSRAVEEIGYGTPDLGYEPDEELPLFQNPHEPRRMLVARAGGAIVGCATYETIADTDTAWILVEVLPEHRGRGIGTALADALEALSAGEGRTKLLVYTPIRDVPGARLAPPTGFGSISVTPDVTFLQRRGYSLEQVERLSRLALPVADLEARLAAATVRSGPDYVLRFWSDRTPERWRADYAYLGTRMSTDAPSAGLEEPENPWSVERVIESDDRNDLSPRTRLAVAVEHLPTGRLVGFSVLSVPPQPARAVDQYATLVLREHRGHALGMLMKLGNLDRLARVAPGHPSVLTFNAEENRAMLDVNEAIGFVGIAKESAWRKDI